MITSSECIAGARRKLLGLQSVPLHRLVPTKTVETTRLPFNGHIAPSSSSGFSTYTSSTNAPVISTSPSSEGPSGFFFVILCGSNVFPSSFRNTLDRNLCCAGVNDSGSPSCAKVVCEPGTMMRMFSSLKGGMLNEEEAGEESGNQGHA